MTPIDYAAFIGVAIGAYMLGFHTARAALNRQAHKIAIDIFREVAERQGYKVQSLCDCKICQRARERAAK